MRALVQRVSRAKVHIRRAGSALGADLSGHAGVSSIGWGLTAFVGVGHGDGPEQARSLAHKMAALRIFEDETGRMNRSLIDTGGSVLAVSQFTLYADLRKGNRPSFGEAAPPDVARDLFVRFVTALRELGVRVETGVFGADMDVELVNDGPVTMWLDTARFGPRRDPP